MRSIKALVERHLKRIFIKIEPPASLLLAVSLLQIRLIMWAVCSLPQEGSNRVRLRLQTSCPPPQGWSACAERPPNTQRFKRISLLQAKIQLAKTTILYAERGHT